MNEEAAKEKSSGDNICQELESFENGQMMVLFTGISSSTGSLVSSGRSYKLCSQLKVLPFCYFYKWQRITVVEKWAIY